MSALPGGWKPSEPMTRENHPPRPCCDEVMEFVTCSCGLYDDLEPTAVPAPVVEE
jgi:hypothetical protein